MGAIDIDWPMHGSSHPTTTGFGGGTGGGGKFGPGSYLGLSFHFMGLVGCGCSALIGGGAICC